MPTDSEKATFEKEMKIAAMGGAGLPLSVVAREVGVSREKVEYVLERKVERNANGLGDVYEQFREQMRPIIQDLVRVTLGKLAQRIQGPRVEIRDLVAVYNILAAHAGLGEVTTEVLQRRVATIDTKNPAVLKAVREALVTERTQQSKALASGDTP